MKKVLILFTIILGTHLNGVYYVFAQMESPTYRIDNDSISGVNEVIIPSVYEDDSIEKNGAIFSISDSQQSEAYISFDYLGILIIVGFFILLSTIFFVQRFYLKKEN